jgi:hypothetical protein
MEIKKVPKGKVDFYRSVALDVISEIGG